MKKKSPELERLLRVRLQQLDARLGLPHVGLAVGVVLGVLYTVQSAPHMTVQNAHDLYIIGALLALLGGCLGWLAGVLLARPLRNG